MLEVELCVALSRELWCVPSLPQVRSAGGCAHGSHSGVTGRRWKTPPQNCVHGKKAKEGIMPSTQKSIYQIFITDSSEQTPDL